MHNWRGLYKGQTYQGTLGWGMVFPSPSLPASSWVSP